MFSDSSPTTTSTSVPSQITETRLGSDDSFHYKHPVPEVLDGVDDFGSLPLPIQVMEQYKAWHSVDQLLSEQGDDDNRRYSIIFYTCPYEAGNRLHQFTSALLWSILTNRTALWRYYDREACMHYGASFNPVICENANQVQDCDNFLDRAPWIPAYDDFVDHILEEHEELYDLPFYSTHPHWLRDGKVFQWGPGNDETSRGVDVKFRDKKLVHFAQTRGKITFLQDPAMRELLLHSEWGRTTAENLYSLGADFLFGMLLRYSFSFTDRLTKSVSRRLPSTNAFTIALHARHINPEHDGCDIHLEQACLKEMLQQNEHDLPCHIALMSDRTCTVSSLEAWLREEGLECQAHVTEHEMSESFYAEHGPFATTGYFQDVIFASSAQSAFIATLERSSSHLVLELMEFEKMMSAWRRGQDPSKIGRIPRCHLPINKYNPHICCMDNSTYPVE